MIDTKERIVRSNIYSIFGKLMNRLIDNNDDGEVLLKKAGLSSFVDEQQYEKLTNYLNVIGYELLETVEEDDYYETINYYLIPDSSGAQQRNSDVTYLRSMLVMHHSDLVILYDEAISNFGSGQYVSCIENCGSFLC